MNENLEQQQRHTTHALGKSKRDILLMIYYVLLLITAPLAILSFLIDLIATNPNTKSNITAAKAGVGVYVHIYEKTYTLDSSIYQGEFKKLGGLVPIKLFCIAVTVIMVPCLHHTIDRLKFYSSLKSLSDLLKFRS
ncbi:hypothetical protein AX774_g1468 [Zancudomyces culisetae]|uniref:Uncharacterized protein n=1 Tax=Zancudomyces culisetae TaxID=1213189 RepID=A0A1R1PVL1_ZANCU|nr:hypothetical protein AX774_g1468 [Zancudomyces culisetae]|eukprot:OMH84993.1 hypothetical protein AX774_g1468 [Zancudomyces culisetae]